METTLYDDWIKPLGEDYPAAIAIGRTRIPLAYESRFTRHYLETKPDVQCHTGISRFLDETASITLRQLEVHLERRRPHGLLRFHGCSSKHCAGGFC